jgi:A/G-specific adenine glycosylase
MGKSKLQGDSFSKSVLDWYDRNRRDLPWRALPGEKPDPYAVWLSEVMLQQTTVAAVAAYYRKFLALWPGVEHLASASTESVMQAWAGLGYYSRARNLHACAQKIVADFGGRFPEDVANLQKLPGVGPYTAAAIAAIAFDRKATVVDGNIERVAARNLALETELPAGKKDIAAFVEAVTPERRPGDFAQALMDLGAGVCTPRNPSCLLCPLKAGCKGFASGRPQDFPRKAAKKPRPLRRGAIFYLRRADGAVLTRTRPPRGLLGGMVEFCGSDWKHQRAADWALRRFEQGAPDAPQGAPIAGVNWAHAGEVDHVFTHFALSLSVFVGAAPHGARVPDACCWLDAAEMRIAALPSVMRKVEAAAQAHLAASGLSAARNRS